MAVINDAQLSKDFEGLCLAKGILIFALSSAVIHSIAFSVVLSIYFAQPHVHSEDHGQFQGHEILMTSRNYKMS